MQFDSLPFYVVAGNHDHRGDVNAQILYKDAFARWVFPSLWYPLSFSFKSSSGKDRRIQLLMIDTVSLAGACHMDRGCTLPGPSDAFYAESQWAWIESELRSSTADFLWVVGHYPIYSAGEDGTTHVLVKQLLPLLKDHGAHYIDGHDHMLEHISYDGVEMYVTGAGRECCDGIQHLHTVPEGAIKYLITGPGGQQGVGPKPSAPVMGGFTSFQFDDAVIVKYHNHDGEVIYTAPEVPPRYEGTVVV